MTIQATSKQYKSMQLLGVLLVLVGVVAGIAEAPVFGVTTGVLGLALYIGGRIGGWWANG